MTSLNIKNPHVYELAKQVSEVTGKSMTSAVELALERLLAELTRPKRGTADRLMDLAARTAPLLAHLPADASEDLYDPVTGAPR